MSLYELNDIAQHYGGRTVLTVDHWQIPPNKVLGLAGPNGSGKTTLLKLLGFIERPSRGRLLFNGRSAERFDPDIRNKVACLPQDPFLLKRSVFRNVAYGMNIRRDRRDRERCVRQALEWVGLAPDLFSQRPWYALSGGEARRVALAARLVLQPQVLLLDEPTSSVDEASSRKIQEAVLQAHRQWGTSLIIAGHDMPWMQHVCDDVFYMFHGRLAGSDRVTFIFGPWTRLSNSHAVKTLDQGQQFKAGAIPSDSDSAVASIEANKLSMHANPGQVPPGHHQLQGVLTQLSYDKRSACLWAQVVVGTTAFYVHLTAESALARHIDPGRHVTIAYDPGDVRWHHQVSPAENPIPPGQNGQAPRQPGSGRYC